MNPTASHSLSHSLRTLLATATAAALLAACAADAPVAPRLRVVELGSCQKLQPPEGNEISYHVYATGAQIYRWTGMSWSFVGPSAVLYADAGEQGAVGTHSAGPTWVSNSGSKVVGAVDDRCTPDANAIPWLLLHAVSAEGPGIFDSTTFIQRVKTVGGNAPATPGTTAGELASVPYTAEYYFYRRQ
jgi:hypothetical protein